MRYGTHLKVLAAAVVASVILVGSSYAQDNPVAPVQDSDVIKPQAVCAVGTPVRIDVLTPAVEMLGPTIRSQGGITFLKGKEKFTAAGEVEYNTDTGIGIAHDITFTTCCAVRPDWHLTASEATLLPNHRLYVKNVSLYAGRTRLLVLPLMRLRVGGRSATAAIFPRLGYDARDGVSLSQTLRLTDTTHSRTTMDLRFTTQHSIEGNLDSIYGAGGRLINFPGRYLTYGSMRSRALNVPQQTLLECDPEALRPVNAARLQPFGRITLRQRTYDATNLGLVVFRQPEVGASYIGGQLSLTKHKLDPRIELYPQITASWGRFKEIPGLSDYLGRTMVSMQGSVNAAWLGPYTSIQPLGILTYASYQDSQMFQTYGFGLDVAHITPSSYYSARYISRTSTGSTPFLFDNIDINKEIDVAFQTSRGRNVVGVAMNYDAQHGSLFDWELLLGQRRDCLGTYVRWDNRFKRFSFDLVLINL